MNPSSNSFLPYSPEASHHHSITLLSESNANPTTPTTTTEMSCKSQTRASGNKRCNQPRSHRNPSPKPSKPLRTPGHSRYEYPGQRAGWNYNAWLLRRSLKVQPSSQPQDLIRCYEAMTPGIYQANLQAKMEVESGFCFRENRRRPVQPASYDNLLLPKRVPKKETRGAGAAGRRTTSATGLRILRRIETRGKSASLSNGERESRRDIDRGVELGHCLGISAQVSQTSRKISKQVHFDEESEWLDISDVDVPDGLVEAERWTCSEDEDEYVLV